MKRSPDQADDGIEDPSGSRSFLDSYWPLVAVALALVAAGIGLFAAPVERLPDGPQVSWETEHRSENATVAVVHQGGEPVDATNLRVDVEGSDAAIVSSPSGTVTPGDRLLVHPIEPGDEAEIVHVDPEDDRETVLHTWSVA